MMNRSSSSHKWLVRIARNSSYIEFTHHRRPTTPTLKGMSYDMRLLLYRMHYEVQTLRSECSEQRWQPCTSRSIAVQPAGHLRHLHLRVWTLQLCRLLHQTRKRSQVSIPARGRLRSCRYVTHSFVFIQLASHAEAG